MDASGSPVLIGYVARRTAAAPPPLFEIGVREVCAVSGCLTTAPEGWIQAWRHNDWGAFDSPDAAWSVVPESERGAYDLYAWELVPARWVAGVNEPMVVDAADVVPLDDAFRPLGYDVVSRSGAAHFECSALTCNLWAREVGANAHGLVDDPAEAERLAAAAEGAACEPGPYHVVRVWRRPRATPDEDGAG